MLDTNSDRTLFVSAFLIIVLLSLAMTNIIFNKKTENNDKLTTNKVNKIKEITYSNELEKIINQIKD